MLCIFNCYMIYSKISYACNPEEFTNFGFSFQNFYVTLDTKDTYKVKINLGIQSNNV